MSKKVIDNKVPLQRDYQISSSVQLATLESDFQYEDHEIVEWLGSDGNSYAPSQVIPNFLKNELNLTARWQRSPLTFTSTDSTKALFKANDPKILSSVGYVNNSSLVQEPYNLSSNISIREKLASVRDSSNEITSLKVDAFCNCPNLHSAYFQAVTSIGKRAFSNCQSLSSASFFNVTDIEQEAFSNCNNLSSIILPSTLALGDRVFLNCFELTSIYANSVTSIEQACFSNCQKLLEFNSKSLTSIESEVFHNCTSLSSCQFKQVKIINSQAFSDCSSLTKVDFPQILSVGEYAFYGCSSLTSIHTKTAEELKDYSFVNCSDLSSAIIPNVKTIGTYVFSGCDKLSSVYLYGVTSPTQILADSFGEKRQWVISVYVNYGMKDTFDASDIWKDINVETGSGIVQVIGDMPGTYLIDDSNNFIVDDSGNKFIVS